MAENAGKTGTDQGENGADEAPRPEPEKELTPAAKRALAEAEARRAAATPVERPKEYDGPKGEEPTRFGDWERKGIASDF